MVLVDIKKYVFVLLLLASTTTALLPESATPSAAYKVQTASTRYEDEIVEFDDEEGLINANEKINPHELIKGWAAFLARGSKYFFVVANRLYIWWYGSARRNVVRG